MQTVTVAAVSMRNLIGQADATIEAMRHWAALATDQGAELILFPELNVSGYIPAPVARSLAEPVPGPSTEPLIRLAGDLHTTLCYGLLEQEGEWVHCTQVLVNSCDVIGKQRKIHVPAQEQPFWEAGSAIEVFDIGKARVGIAICRDAFFGEMTTTLYFRGAEIILIPFGYYNVPRCRYLQESIHAMAILQASWSNGVYSVVCNSAEGREPNEWEPEGRRFPGWARVISSWGRMMSFVDGEGDDRAALAQ